MFVFAKGDEKSPFAGTFIKAYWGEFQKETLFHYMSFE